MVSRPSRRAFGTLTLILWTVIALFVGHPAAAATRGYPSDDPEGDPGDGVLDPSSSESMDYFAPGGSNFRLPPKSPTLEPPEFILVPIVSGSGSPWPLTFRVVHLTGRTDWRLIGREGRWQHAP